MESQQFHRISKALAEPRRYELLSRIAKCRELACSDVRVWRKYLSQLGKL